jgi:hypothetical protein
MNSKTAMTLVWLSALSLAPLLCPAQTKEALQEETAAIPRAPVIFEGGTLFLIRGVSALPAGKRAEAIADRIRAGAKDPAYAFGTMQVIEARGQLLLTVTSADAAAERTAGLLRQPRPFVLHSTLGDFCITYELNVYCDRPSEQLQLYSLLHANIIDVFTEHNVQIMTPAYVIDPEQPKVVPKDKWFESPAKSPAVSAAGGSATTNRGI